MKKLLVILFLFTGSLYASIGNITKSLGDIYIIRDMKSQKANIGDEILTKDLLFSRSKSKVEITFIDDTVISIGQKSTFLIEEYFFDENDKANSRCSFKFSKGSFRSVSGKIGKIAKENFKLKTKNANISIKGTINGANQYVDENGIHVTTTITFKGATEVKGQNGAGQLVGAGMANNVLGNQPAFIPFNAPLQLLEAFNIATDPTTSQTPNLSVFSQKNTINSVLGNNGDTISKKLSQNQNKTLNNSLNISNNKIENSNLPADLDNENSWGTWEDITPFSGKSTDDRINQGENNLETVVQGLINDNSTNILNFEGTVSGTVTGGTIVDNSNNLMTLTLSLGGGTNSFGAIVGFEDTSGRLWSIEYVGGSNSATTTGLSGSYVAGPLSDVLPDGPITGGNISGSYSGTSSITAINGTWDATTGALNASGTFHVDKQ